MNLSRLALGALFLCQRLRPRKLRKQVRLITGISAVRDEVGWRVGRLLRVCPVHNHLPLAATPPWFSAAMEHVETRGPSHALSDWSASGA